MRRIVLVAVLAAVVGAVVATPIAVYASHQFTDVPTSNIFHADIDWLADAGVTKGCNPPANDEFCPKDVVTRETMAAFLHRLAVNQVVDADKVDGLDSHGFVRADQMLYASVASNGDLVAGNAVSAVRIFDGRYIVEFDRNLNNCTASATAGTTGTNSGFDFGVTMGVALFNNEADVFVAKVFGAQEEFYDNSFHLIAVCP